MWYREHLGVIRGSDTCVDSCGKDNVKIMLLKSKNRIRLLKPGNFNENVASHVYPEFKYLSIIMITCLQNDKPQSSDKKSSI